MIRRVLSVRSFGVLDHFDWPATLQGFRRFNLIYGWNYSGKTTLSRVFRCFAQKARHPDFDTAEVTLETSDGQTHSLSKPQTAPSLRVFNSDFVRENLSFDDSSAAPILVLGQDDIARQSDLRDKQAQRAKLRLSRQASQTERQDKEAAIERALSDHARMIKNLLRVPNYDRTRFAPVVQKCRATPAAHILDNHRVNELSSIFLSEEKKPELPARICSLTSVSELWDLTKDILGRVVSGAKPLSRLVKAPDVEDWVKRGRRLHEGKETCQFCGQPLPPSLLPQLAAHFSDEYDLLMADLQSLINRAKSAKAEQITLAHRSDFYPEFSDRFSTEERHLKELLEARTAALNVLLEALRGKETKAFTKLDCPSAPFPESEVAAALEAINGVIRDHNKRTSAFEKKRAQAFATLEKHYAACFVRDLGYEQRLAEISHLGNLIKDQGDEFSELQKHLVLLEAELSEASKGAQRLNELISACFGRVDLRIEVTPDKRFMIMRGAKAARNLSEGEKTAIAFAYFIVRLQDGHLPLANAIVVIDDPVSSLDGNHIFNTYALIKTQLASCRQLFVLTHSFDFYNLLRDWAAETEKKKPPANWTDSGIFIMSRTDDGYAVLEPAPRELLIFRSEYHYLFSTMYHFDRTGSADFDRMLSLPNVVRRFMEAFGGIMIPRAAGLKAKMRRFFGDEVDRERVWKFVNHYSHNDTITRSLSIPDTSECRAVVKACLKAVREWNEHYYRDMEQEVAAATDT